MRKEDETMPQGFFYAPALFKHKEVTVFGIHIDDHASNKLREDKFGWSSYSSDEGEDSFYLRDLPNFNESQLPYDVLINAIDCGYLTQRGITVHSQKKVV